MTLFKLLYYMCEQSDPGANEDLTEVEVKEHAEEY